MNEPTKYVIETIDLLTHRQHLAGLDALCALLTLRGELRRRRKYQGSEKAAELERFLFETLDSHGLDLDVLCP